MLNVAQLLRPSGAPAKGSSGCPAAGGVLSFCRNPANVIDLVAIMPWYIDRVGLEGPGFLSLLRIIRITRIARIFKMSKNMQVEWVG